MRVGKIDAVARTLAGAGRRALRRGTLYTVVHRDTLLAAQERILALERELAGLRSREDESVPATIARLERDKRALETERTRLVVEREQLVDDLAKVKAALARAEEEAARARREVKDALAIRDELRKRAIEEATRAGAARRTSNEARESAAAPVPPAPRKRGRSSGRGQRLARGERRADERAEGPAPSEERITLAPKAIDALPTAELVALDAHNRGLPSPRPAHEGVGVLCPSCLARGERVEMLASRSALGLGSIDAISAACLRCGAVGLKRTR